MSFRFDREKQENNSISIKANLIKASLGGANLNGAKLSGSLLIQADFRPSSLSH